MGAVPGRPDLDGTQNVQIRSSSRVDPADDPPGTVPVQAVAICGQEDGSFGAFADGQVDHPGSSRCEWDGDYLAALAGNHQGPVAAFDAERFDAGAGGFRHPQPVEGEQGDECMYRFLREKLEGFDALA